MRKVVQVVIGQWSTGQCSWNGMNDPFDDTYVECSLCSYVARIRYSVTV